MTAALVRAEKLPPLEKLTGEEKPLSPKQMQWRMALAAEMAQEQEKQKERERQRREGKYGKKDQ